MHRVGLPKVAIITLDRPKKLNFTHKVVRISSDFYRGSAALIAYKDFSDVAKYVKEVGANDYFLLDEERFISYVNESEPTIMKNIQEKLKDKKVIDSSKHLAEKSTFHIFDTMFETYWILS